MLRLAAEGHTNRAIARQLNISERMVHRHLARFRNRFGLHGRTHAVAYAIRQQLI
ncbi:response regulator transcription factor [Streptomyces sp. NPDC087851]|uniref:response regulator transcription factor n=1 Tax=Streptomyces sp. NPDC087851 TaxID=3365810 RepID=UPI0038125B26